jgi:hypothetical protein
MKGGRSLPLRAFAALLIPSLALAAEGSGQQDPGAAWSMARDGQVLPALVMAERLFETDRMPAGSLAQLMAVVGDADGVEKLLWRDGGPQDPGSEETARVSVEPAIDAIVRLAANKRIVILNETHHDQRHRAFAMRLALRLREVGFTHLGAETFTESISESMKDGAPDGRGGVYVIDPVFADFVRQAYKAGYLLFSYEQTAAQAEAAEDAGINARMAREEAQASNILRILTEEPHARLFIYVGGSHLLETDDDSGRAWMAKILKHESGVDPLTIDQTFGTPRLSRGREGRLYRQVERHLSRYPAIARDERGRLLARAGTDITVFHPSDSVPTPRPNWLFMCGYRMPYDIPLERSSSRRLVRAFLSGEPDGSIPVDQVLVERNAAAAFLMLPPGRYRIESQSEAGNSAVLDASFDTLKARGSWTLRKYRDAESCKQE